MYGAFRISRELPVGITLSFSVDKYIMYTFPFPGGGIITIHHHITLAGCPGAIYKNEVTISKIMELGIRDIVLSDTNHRLKVAEHKGIGCYAPAIPERMAVVVKRKMQVTGSVHPDRYDIVCIGHIPFILSGADFP